MPLFIPFLLLPVGFLSLLFLIAFIPLPRITLNKTARNLFYGLFFILLILGFIYAHQLIFKMQSYFLDKKYALWLPVPECLWLDILLGMFYMLTLGAILENRLFRRKTKASEGDAIQIQNKSHKKPILRVVLTCVFSLIFIYLMSSSLNSYVAVTDAGITYNPVFHFKPELHSWDVISRARVFAIEKSYYNKGVTHRYMDPDYIIYFKNGASSDIWEALSPLPGAKTDTNTLIAITRQLVEHHIAVQVEDDDIYNMHKLKKQISADKLEPVLATFHALNNTARGLDMVIPQGQLFRLDNIIYRIYSVEEILSSGIYQSRPREVLLRIGLSINNQSTRTNYLSTLMNVRLADQYGKEYSSLITETPPYPDTLPGQSSRGHLVFLIPRDNGPWTLRVKPSFIKEEIIHFEIRLK